MASWVCEKAASDPESTLLCEFYETFDRAATAGDLASFMLPGVYMLADLRTLGRERRVCPYFLTRQMVKYANVVVYSYQYLLDPKVANRRRKVLSEIYGTSPKRSKGTIGFINPGSLGERLPLQGRFKATDANRLRAEYNRLVDGLAQRGNLSISDAWLANPALPDDILKEAVPGNIRRAEHFLAVLQRLAGIDQKMLRFCYDRLHSLMMTLEITDTDEFMHIQTICTQITLDDLTASLMCY
ncbi:general transcription and DNA repair factor IIH helicase subunit XPD-like [Miscanthus floridulus]|uniref:general transcription and DNA repair factor IIH helicase subunit XPD-like n=1 Tax=Miscanthus floridulus TaxID=154761 RepID=UPI003459C7F2